jgi:hypothetical protein
LENSLAKLENFRIKLRGINRFTGEWCNGSTTDSDSVCLGSNPGSPANKNNNLAENSEVHLPRNLGWEDHGKTTMSQTLRKKTTVYSSNANQLAGDHVLNENAGR